MNCLEARRLMLEKPVQYNQALYDHLNHCKSCRIEHQRTLAFETSLADAISTEPPTGLKEKILLHGHFLAERRRRHGYTFAAMAFGLLMVTGLSLKSSFFTPAPIVTTVLSHIDDERHHLHEVRSVSKEKINTLLATLDGQYEGAGLQINYAGRCQIRSRQGLHLVVQGKQGPVSILVMPGEHQDVPLAIHDQRFQGSVFPSSYGSFAVVGEQNEEIDPIAQQIRKSLTFTL